MTLPKHVSGVMIATGFALLLYNLFFLGSDLSAHISGVVLGAALILSGILFWFIEFTPERRNYAICMLNFGIVALFVGLIISVFLDPLLATGAFMFGTIILIVGILFWFFEPKGSGPLW